MTLTYATKLDLKIRKTDIGTQNIDGSTFQTFVMVLTSFWIEYKSEKA